MGPPSHRLWGASSFVRMETPKSKRLLKAEPLIETKLSKMQEKYDSIVSELQLKLEQRESAIQSLEKALSIQTLTLDHLREEDKQLRKELQRSKEEITDLEAKLEFKEESIVRDKSNRRKSPTQSKTVEYFREQDKQVREALHRAKENIDKLEKDQRRIERSNSDSISMTGSATQFRNIPSEKRIRRSQSVGHREGRDRHHSLSNGQSGQRAKERLEIPRYDSEERKSRRSQMVTKEKYSDEENSKWTQYQTSSSSIEDDDPDDRHIDYYNRYAPEFSASGQDDAIARSRRLRAEAANRQGTAPASNAPRHKTHRRRSMDVGDSHSRRNHENRRRSMQTS
mmetsp:Transcript_1561/g.2141  ORF Transcript_1561/g.2141 Transcript_1561/m.2141 type:complete len:340 (+) Transcript_1561:149-1168(+)